MMGKTAWCESYEYECNASYKQPHFFTAAESKLIETPGLFRNAYSPCLSPRKCRITIDWDATSWSQNSQRRQVYKLDRLCTPLPEVSERERIRAKHNCAHDLNISITFLYTDGYTSFFSERPRCLNCWRASLIDFVASDDLSLKATVTFE